MTKLVLRLTGSVLSHPLRWLILLGVVYVLAILQIPKFGVDNTLEIWFKRDDPTIEAYRRFQDTFGNDETILAVFRDEKNELSIMHLRHISSVTDALAGVAGVRRVTSLANFPNPEMMMSEDRQSTVFVIEPESFERMDEARPELIAAVRATLDEAFARTPWDYQIVGVGVIYDALNRATLVDSRLLFALSYVLMVVLLVVFVRKLRLVLLCTVALFYAVTVSVGIYLAAGRQFNMITIIIPSVVTVYAVSDVLHTVHSYRRRILENAGAEKHELIKVSIRSVALPCFLASVTTAVGFLSLMISDIQIIRDLGLFGAIGVLVAYLSTLVILTLGFRFFPVPELLRPRRALLARLSATGRNRWGVLIAACTVTVVLAAGIPRLIVDTSSIGLLRRNHQVRRESEFVESTFGYYTPVEFVLSGDSLSPNLVDGLEKVESIMEAHPLIAHPVSILDVVPDIRRIESKELVSAYLDERNPEAIAAFVDRETNSVRITARTQMLSARGFKAVIDDVLAVSQRSGHSLVPAGYLPLYVRMMEYIPSTQVRSSLVAFVVILGLLLVHSRSIRLALCALAANTVPIVAVLGLMGWVGIPLDIATVTITAMAIGIIVDDTIHMIHGIRSSSIAGSSRASAIASAITESGSPIIATTVVLGLGYCVMAFATVGSISRFGMLTALILLLALLCDLYVLPALYVGGRKRGES